MVAAHFVLYPIQLQSSFDLPLALESLQQAISLLDTDSKNDNSNETKLSTTADAMLARMQNNGSHASMFDRADNNNTTAAADSKIVVKIERDLVSVALRHDESNGGSSNNDAARWPVEPISNNSDVKPDNVGNKRRNISGNNGDHDDESNSKRRKI
jgi:hypothetical protein